MVPAPHQQLLSKGQNPQRFFESFPWVHSRQMAVALAGGSISGDDESDNGGGDEIEFCWLSSIWISLLASTIVIIER